MTINKLSPDWIVAKQWLQDQIEKSHRNMESPLSPDAYNFERGRIALARDLIEEVEPTSPPQTSEEDYGISTPETGSYA